MKNLDFDNSVSPKGHSKETLVKEQSSQTILTCSDIERNGLFVEIEEKKKGKLSVLSLEEHISFKSHAVPYVVLIY